MAMNADELERQILDVFRSEGRALYPNVLKRVEVRQVPREDGTVDTEVTEHRGPLDMDVTAATIMARAIARAVVSHITNSAEVTTTAASGTWRVS